MKYLFNVLVLILVFNATSYGQKNSEVIKKSLKVENDNSEFWFCLCNINGSVEVEAYEGSTIELELNKQVSARNNSDVKEGMENLKVIVSQGKDYAKVIMQSPDHVIEEKNDPLDCGWSWNGNRRGVDYQYRFDYKIRVPKGISLKISTVNNGDIDIRNAGGNIYANNVNGDVALDGIRGNTKAHTVNGVIEVSYDEMPDEFGSFKTVNGNIVLRTPEKSSATYNFQTQWGKVFSDIDFDAKLSPKMVKTSGRSGETKYKISNSNGYQVGEGGPSMEFETLNGDIRLKKKK